MTRLRLAWANEMADPTQTTDDPVPTAGPRSRWGGPFWHVPVFLAGICALLGVWFARPVWRGSESQRWQRELAAVRRALTESPPDPERAVELSEQLLDAAGPPPDRAGELHFLCGSAYLLRGHDAPQTLASAYSNQAREHLERAAALGVPPLDRATLDYRLAKVVFSTGGDAREVIRRLESALDAAAEDPFEGYGMLAEAYLRLTPPDLPAALEASKKRLASRTAKDEQLAPARLFHGELLLRQGMDEQARQMLSRIGPEAPPEILAKARSLHAQSCQALGRWDEAARLWEAALADSAHPPDQPGRAGYFLGVSYDKTGKHAEAKRAWDGVLARGGEEAQAAAIALAEAHRRGKSSAEAIRFFGRALQSVSAPAEYRNTLAPLPEVRRLMREACRQLHDAGDFESCCRLCRLYERVAAPGAAAEVRGLAEEAWAAQLRQAQRPDEARKHWLEAGIACAAVAEATSDAAARAPWLRRSAEHFIEAQDNARALVEWKKYLRAEPAPERIAEGWFALAHAYEELPDEALALEAYRKCIEYDAPTAFRARFRLAEIEIARGYLDSAQEMLKQNVELMRGSAEDPLHEKSLTALADLLYRRKHYRLANAYYQEVLARYPSPEGNARTRFRLADTYRRMAVEVDHDLAGLLPPAVRLDRQKQYAMLLRSAAETFQKLSLDLAARRAPGPLGKEEEAILRQSDFARVQCSISLGQYQEAIATCESLVQRYRHQVEQLQALREVWRCYWMLSEPQPAAATITRVRDLLRELDEMGFRGYPPEEDRNYWLRWVAEKSQPPPPAAGRPMGNNANVRPPTSQ